MKKLSMILMGINGAAFILAGVALANLWRKPGGRDDVYAYVLLAILIIGSLFTVISLYVVSRSQEASVREAMKNLEEMNLKLRAQRHDYLNHVQVLHGLLEMNEYAAAKEYIEPLFKDILKMSHALKTAIPAVNALLQAKMETAAGRDIDMYITVTSELKGLAIESWELCKVLANLIDNGITVLQEKEGERTLRINIAEDRESFIFEIENNGKEIPKEVRKNIFLPGVTSKKEEGHGMGLAIVEHIVKNEKGEILLFSDEQRTTFTIRFPKCC